MNPFSYAKPGQLTEAVTAASSTEAAKFIGGGTNLLDLMKVNVMRPQHLIDLNSLPLKTIEATADGGLRIGALATNAETAYDAQVIRRYPMLSEAILAGASAQLRNMATNGGNLLQRTRCYYFYDTGTPCNKRTPGEGCSALEGFNRIHAIFGASEHCIATHPSDMCVALAALRAVVRITGKNGERTIPFDDFHRLPGDTPHLDANLSADEVITAIDLPPEGFPDHSVYLKLRDRASYAFALVSVAVGLELEGNTIRNVGLALGGVAHKPWRDPGAEALLVGKTADRDQFTIVAEAVLANARPYRDNAFKVEMAKRAIVRALEMAAKGEKQ